jgi:hypothetical protein
MTQPQIAIGDTLYYGDVNQRIQTALVCEIDTRHNILIAEPTDTSTTRFGVGLDDLHCISKPYFRTAQGAQDYMDFGSIFRRVQDHFMFRYDCELTLDQLRRIDAIINEPKTEPCQ